MMYRHYRMIGLVIGSLALAGTAAAGPLSGSSGNQPATSTGNVLSVSFESSDERTEVAVDRFMGTDPDYRFETYHRRPDREIDVPAAIAPYGSPADTNGTPIRGAPAE